MKWVSALGAALMCVSIIFFVLFVVPTPGFQYLNHVHTKDTEMEAVVTLRNTVNAQIVVHRAEYVVREWYDIQAKEIARHGSAEPKIMFSIYKQDNGTTTFSANSDWKLEPKADGYVIVYLVSPDFPELTAVGDLVLHYRCFATPYKMTIPNVRLGVKSW